MKGDKDKLERDIKELELKRKKLMTGYNLKFYS